MSESAIHNPTGWFELHLNDMDRAMAPGRVQTR